MPESIFFRLLKTPIDAKGDALAAQIAALNAGEEAGETFAVAHADLSMVPGSPFAYWVSGSIRRLFTDLPQVESEERVVRVGDHPGTSGRFLRLFWEVHPGERSPKRQWLPYQKGGAYSTYYYDIHLMADWDLERETYYGFHGRPGRSAENPSNYQLFFRPGLTWPRRTQKGFNLRALPEGCIFADKGPVVFVPYDDPTDLLALLAVMNSQPFKTLVELQMAFGSYEVGVIQRTPIPANLDEATPQLAALAREAHDLQRDRDRYDETTHAFGLPGLVARRLTSPPGPLSTRGEGDLGGEVPRSLREAGRALEAEEQARQARLAAIQAEIDDIVFDLYGLSEADRALIRAEMGEAEPHPGSAGPWPLSPSPSDGEGDSEDGGEAEEEAAPPEDLPARVQNLLMWCVGVAFGRWDVRKALDPARLPPLGGPFDPLPRCAPGALVGGDGLPLASPLSTRGEGGAGGEVYPLPIAWDGILVDDPTHPSDIVARVRGVLALLWGEDAAEGVEREACEALGVKALRDYFRDPRRFFAFHIRRYSKSRRKAPIYWLLQSEGRGYAIWLYCHRVRRESYFVAGRDYTDAKVALEQMRLEDLRAGLGALQGSARRQREREIERQEKLVAEVTAFRKTLDAVALRMLPPDLNDGVLISIAPLWELVPWKEAASMWEKLAAGAYAWSTMARQMRERGFVR